MSHPRNFAVKAYRSWNRFSSPFLYLSRRFMKKTASNLALRDNGICLDVGAGIAPLRDDAISYFKLAHYIALDMAPSDNTDVTGDAQQLPFATASIDLACCLEVLAHLRQPQQALREIARVLKPDGYLIVNYLFIYPECDVIDFGRWSLPGITQLLADCGFEIEMTEQRGGPCFAFAGLLNWCAQHIIPGRQQTWRASRNMRGYLRQMLILLTTLPTLLLCWLALGLDKLLPSAGFYMGGMILAKKVQVPS